MEHDMEQRDSASDTGQLASSSSSSSDEPQECRSSHGMMSQSQTHSGSSSGSGGRHHASASWSGKSEPYVQTQTMDNSDEMKMSPVAVSYHGGDIAKHHSISNLNFMGEQEDLERGSMMSNENESLDHDCTHASPVFPLTMQDNAPFTASVSKFATPDIAPKPLPFASSKDCQSYEIENSNATVGGDLLNNDLSSPQNQALDLNREGRTLSLSSMIAPAAQIQMILGQSITSSSCVPIEGRLELADSIMPDSPNSDHENYAESIMNSKCVPVEGRLADYLVDNESSGESDEDNDDEGGIVILGESTEEEYEESLSESLENDDASDVASDTNYAESHIEFTQASMYQNDPIIQVAAASVKANPIPVNGNASLDFEQLLEEADDHSESNIMSPEIEEQSNAENSRDASNENVSGQATFWRRNPFSSSNRQTAEPLQSHAIAIRTPSQRTPVRATRVRHDKYVVEIDIFPSDEANNSILDTRDVMDIMANIELLHLWFDPVPAVFDAAITDGSANSSIASPRSSPSNSLECGDASSSSPRQYDGQWVEISTPPLTIPSDSRIYGCLRAIRVVIRSMIGFPARIRSMIFVERSCGRIGMTLGPYPDGFLCFQNGTMAYHTYTIRMSDEESGTAVGGRRCVVISDEVRLQRGGDEEGFNDETKRSCFLCSILRALLGFLEWVLCFRLYQPDLASYMQQTISSMEKLRMLVERGETAAYAGGELIVDGDDSDEGNAMGAPLLG